MKDYFLYFLSFFLFLGCQKKEINSTNNSLIVSKRVSIQQDKSSVEIKSGQYSTEFKISEIPLKNVIVLNASLLGYFTQLGLEDKIIGVSSPEYIYSPVIQQKIKENKIQNVGNEQKYNIEKILALKPDAVFTNHIISFENTYEVLKKNGIKIVFLDEYLEHKPLDKTRYLSVFGVLFKQEKKTDSLIAVIQNNYQNLSRLAYTVKDKPDVLCNEMYGGQWFLPGTNSFVQNYFHDANAILPWKNEKPSFPVSFEEILAKSNKTLYWVNVADYTSRQDLLKINSLYSKLYPFQKGKMYTLGGKVEGKANDYFESGVVRADLVLQDYINIFHPKLLSGQSLIYMKELK